MKNKCIYCGHDIDFSKCIPEIGHLTGMITRKKKCEKCNGQNNYSTGDANKNPIGKIFVGKLK